MTQDRETRLGDAPIEEQYREQMNVLAQIIDEFFNGNAKGDARKTGFVLLTFAYGESSRCNFISNGADRKDLVSLFREMAARFEGQPDIPAGRA